MSKAPILISFQIGRSSGKFNASQSAASAQIAEAIGYEAIQMARRETKIDVVKISARLRQVVETAYTEAVRYAARRMIGRTTYAAWGTEKNANRTKPVDIFIGDSDDSFFAASWYPLSSRQIKKQRQTTGETGGKGKFFLDTGALKSELLSLARSMVKKTGVVKISVKDADTGLFRRPLKSTKVVPVADLKLTLMPNVYPSQIPGTRTGVVSDHNMNMSFEKSLGLSEEAIKKLRGPIIPGRESLYHRPLLQPVFTYWTLYRIPGLVAEALNRGVVNVNRSSRSGVADYSSG